MYIADIRWAQRICIKIVRGRDYFKKQEAKMKMGPK